jgi:hypothetical protein
MVAIYWWGGEDSDCTASGSGTTVDTTSGHFRSSYARCALTINAGGNGYWQNSLAFSQSQFWFSFRLFLEPNRTLSGAYLISLVSSDNIDRFRIRAVSNNSNVFQFFKVDASGTQTQLGSNFTLATSGSAPDKWDLFLNDAVAGQINLYLNVGTGPVQIFSFTGDTTTNSVSTIAWFRLFQCQNNAPAAFSEMIVSDSDTRSFSLQTFAAVANGNTHNFDLGSPAASNVNKITNSDATLDGASVGGLIDQYTTGAVASGAFAVLGYGVAARAQCGFSAPNNIDVGVRTGSTDYWSADQTLTTTWQNTYRNMWLTNPNTGNAWQTSEIGSAAGFNIGLRSVT